MTLSAPPLVEDPVQLDVDDLVIKEARRRARHRRWRFVGVGVALAALLGVAVACGPRDAASTHLAMTPAPASAALAATPFVSLPPEAGVLPSTPVTGELVAMIPTESTRAWLYADGRLITMHMFPFTKNEWPNSGFVMQRLTPEGVEIIRSYMETGIGANNLRPIDELGQVVLARSLRVLVDGKMYSSVKMAYSWRCPWGGCEQYVSNLDTRLPASAWADKEYERYVPSRYRICYGGQMQEAADGGWVPVDSVLAALPTEVGQLFASAGHFANHADVTPGENRGCLTAGLAEARLINESIQAVGFGPAFANVAPVYVFTVPGEGEITVRIEFMTVLPHGEAEGNGA
jgi:hypothetical protein